MTVQPRSTPVAAAASTRSRRSLSLLAAAAALTAAAALAPAHASAASSTTWYVSTGAKVEPACAVASAKKPFETIAGALACAGTGDTIKVGAGTFAAGFTVPVGVTIDGAGANKTTLADTKGVEDAVLRVLPGLNTTIENIAIIGSEKDTTGILQEGGSLTLDAVALKKVNGGEGAPVTVAPSAGGGSLTVHDSTLSGGFGSLAGGVYAAGSSAAAPVSVTITNSTITGNLGDAGAILLRHANLTLRDDTIAANTGEGLSGGLRVEAESTATITDSLIAANSGAEGEFADCQTTVMAKVIDGGHNLIGIGTTALGGCGFVDGVNGDLTGTPTTPLDPDLAALANNGGGTETLALEPDSPAISAGNPADCQAEPVGDLDQRGRSRNAITRNTCDIGAYDTAGRDAKALYVSAAAEVEPVCAVASAKEPFETIAGALACAGTGDTIRVGAGTFAAGFTIPVGVTIEGAGASRTTVSNATGLTDAALTVLPDLNTTIASLTISGSGGGTTGILQEGGSLTLSAVALKKINGADGAAVTLAPSVGGGSLTVHDSTISGGFGPNAGGIYADGSSAAAPASATITNTTITGNLGEVGGILLKAADLTLRDDTISANKGAVAGGLRVEHEGTATITDSLIAANTAEERASADCQLLPTAKVVDGGHNLIGIGTTATTDSCGFLNGVNGDLTGTPSTPLDPDLAALASNGGGTETLALEPDSPAISAGNPADCQAEPVGDLDQRGDPRNASTRNTCDIGAYDTAGKA
jgi:hypothetical protein